ncbi:hypothetical protein [Limnofasciculus baicalensis]|uniref:Uncharacterized protein n=1 Tax=Limnofasciculus baicalensis BBK-W-15 TaxID=2699891 RepID=A0AAE3GTJ8_9CYAN|nr:hypothetical protein [Limnofasciculus baicalensis]MCP2729762.1 hypothetical protein [Limnofasciculus baicalensis BBK-W-15]
MANLSERRKQRRGRIFPEGTIPPGELAKRQTERTKIGQRCREIFELIRPELIEKYYNWFIAIEPDSGEYLVDPKLLGIIQKIRDRYGDKEVMLTTFRLNETGACGKI